MSFAANSVISAFFIFSAAVLAAELSIVKLQIRRGGRIVVLLRLIKPCDFHRFSLVLFEQSSSNPKALLVKKAPRVEAFLPPLGAAMYPIRFRMEARKSLKCGSSVGPIVVLIREVGLPVGINLLILQIDAGGREWVHPRGGGQGAFGGIEHE